MSKMGKWLWTSLGVYLAFGGSIAYSLLKLTHESAPLFQKLLLVVFVTLFWLPGMLVAYLVR